MGLTARQILAGTTEQKVLDDWFAVFRDLGFNTTSWQDGSVQKTILRAAARSYAGSANTLADVLDALIINPRGQWQDIRGTYWYQLPRQEASQALRAITFTSAASASPHSITVGSIVATARGIRYETIAGPVSLSPGTSETIACRAIEPGISGNVAAATPLSLVTSYAGVTAAFSGAPTYAGTERETDACYQFRQDRRFSELTYSVGLRAYELWALNADPSIERVVAWNNYPNPGDIRITIAPGTAEQIDNVEAYIAARTPPHDYPTVTAATVINVDVVSAPRIRVGTTSVAELEAAWQAYFDSMPIGGVRVAGAPAGRLLPEYLTRIALCELSGIESVSLSDPDEPLVMARDEIITGVFTTTPEWVP